VLTNKPQQNNHYIVAAKAGKGKGKTKETSANSTTAGAGVTVLSEKKLFLGQKVRFESRNSYSLCSRICYWTLSWSK
jgi:hypothetical protein